MILSIILALSLLTQTTISTESDTNNNNLSNRGGKSTQKRKSIRSNNRDNNERYDLINNLIINKASINQKDIQRFKKCENPLRIYNEFVNHQKINDKNDDDDRIQELFINEIDDAWSYAFQTEERIKQQQQYNSISSSDSSLFPFLTCIKNINSSGEQRLESLTQLFNIASDNNITPIINENKQSCFIINLSPYNAKQIASSSSNIFTKELLYSIIPHTSSMKMEYGLLDTINDRIATRNDDNVLEFIIKTSTDTDDVSINNLLQDVKSMISSMEENNGEQRQRNLLRNTKKFNYKSIYSLLLQNNNYDRLLQEKTSDCNDIFVGMKTKQLSSKNGFKLTLFPTKQTSSCVILLTTAFSFITNVVLISLIPKFTTFNHIAKTLIQGVTNQHEQFTSTRTPFYDLLKLNGNNQVVAVSDTGLDVNNCYFYDKKGEVSKNGVVDSNRRKVVQYTPVVKNGEFGYTPGYIQDDIGGHGTHVCGTVAGHMSRDGIQHDDDDGNNAEYNGVAPNAKIAFLDISLGGDFLNPPADSLDLFHPGVTAGANIHVASWGANVGLNMYSTFSSEYDKYLFDNQNMVFVVASGNFGLNGVSFPGTAKNAITVGASLNRYGPDKNKILGMSGGAIVEGNRKKPDLLAPGSFIGSAYSGLSCDDILWKEGTSMATPVIGGTIALIRQYFQMYPQMNITIPSATLIKAILLNGAQPLYGAGTMPYDYRQNFGLVSLINSLPIIDQQSSAASSSNMNALFYNLISIKNGVTHDYNIIIDNTTTSTSTCNEPLSATLVWHDISTSPFVINDLDLLITDDQSQKNYYPNGLNTKDAHNNAERIRIQKNEGKYTIQVIAFNLVLESIQYSLVITGCFTNSSLIDNTPSSSSSVSEEIFHEESTSIENETESLFNYGGHNNKTHTDVAMTLRLIP